MPTHGLTLISINLYLLHPLVLFFRYCARVEVYDIRQSMSWTFEVNRWFEVLHEGQNKYVLPPSKPTENAPLPSKSKFAKLQKVKEALSSLFGIKLQNQVHLWNLL